MCEHPLPVTVLFDIPNIMNLTEAKLRQTYIIESLQVDEESVVASRLRQLGFVPGISLVCEAVAPLVKNPYLVKIRGINVALARHEAVLIKLNEAQP